MMAQLMTLSEKIWEDHVIMTRGDGASLLYVDQHLLPDGQASMFREMETRGLSIRRSDRTVAVADHYAPSRGRREAVTDPTHKLMIDQLAAGSRKAGIMHLGLDDRRQGIVHVIGPEQGLSHPGMLIVCGDSHTATHGALGAFSFGIGSSEVAHVLATQTIWQMKPKTMRISVEGRLAPGVTPKDVILSIILKIGTAGATGHAIEYAGSTIRDMSMEGRLTVCNMSIEAGARTGMVAPDDKTIAYLEGRPYVPKGAEWDKAVTRWRSLSSDTGVAFDREVEVDAATIAPMVTWGTSPEMAISIDGRVPDPANETDLVRRTSIESALAYMGLTAGTPICDIAVDRVFIGSCTNSRIEDLRAAAMVVAGRRAVVPALVVPGSGLVKAQAEKEGLHAIFQESGFEWGEAGCSMCVGMNGDLLKVGERCASTSNRNFVGRQGKGARTHLVSPQMAAAAALEGRFTDIRNMMGR